MILGAPKCGTTALSEYLRDHPQVFVSRPKEPHYFCDEWDYYYAPGSGLEEHYLRLFEDADDAHLAVGEASVWYLYSTAAARNIAAFDPAMRVIVMVRNPVELVPSLHSQLRYVLDEDEPDPERAPGTSRSARRRRQPPGHRPGPRVPPVRGGRAPRRPARARHEHLPREQVKVLVMDDLKADTGAVYRDALAVLGVPDDGRSEFPRVNENKVHQRPAVARLTQRPPPLVAVAKGVKRVAGIERLGVLDRVRRTNRQVTRREEISPEFADRLRAYFRDDVAC